MKIKVSKTTNLQLDWLVAEALNTGDGQRILENTIDFVQYTTDWSQGGPIIGRENIGLICQQPESTKRCAYHQTAEGEVFYHYGDTLLIAAMRCLVASKLGDEVEVPDELQ